MFNAPRRMAGNALSSSTFLNSSSPASQADPLASSTPNPAAFGEVDPWSASPSPARVDSPRRDSIEGINGQSSTLPSLPVTAAAKEGLNGLIADPPALYLSLLDQMETSATGEVSLASVHRLLGTSKLPAASIEKIVNLTSRDKSSLSRQEFFCALALVALAQSDSEPGAEISIERLSASIPNLPLPRLSVPPHPVTRGYSVTGSVNSTSPWDTAPRQNGGQTPSRGNGDAAGSGELELDAERGWWKRVETLEVSLIPEKEGWFLQKYKVESDKRSGGPVSRRYSDFVWLLDYLTKRYRFRLLPLLPPKRIGPDAAFLEQRRKGLKRFMNSVVNHPVLKEDAVVNVFLSDINFESWRKRTNVTSDEESTGQKLTSAQEMAIPADLEEKLGVLRDHLPALLSSYQKLVIVAERSLARLQAAAADASRIALSLHTIAEEMPRCCYRSAPDGHACSLCAGVAQGLGEVGNTCTTIAEEGEKRAMVMMLSSIEALKAQRDLYIAFRDLFLRHDRWSKDTVDALHKKVEGRKAKIETTRAAQKPGWEVEVDKLASANEQDNLSITNFLNRRVFIRSCLWHELALVFHSRQAAQTTLGWTEFARHEGQASSSMVAVWESLSERLKSMPIE